MPYPPPPGPPELGIFQAIGLVPELPSLVGNYFLTNSGGLTVWEPVSGGVLPDMTGHAGEFLTTDGNAASWAALGDTLPDQTGHGGAYLTTDGAAASWSLVPPIATSNIHDIRSYGAISAANPNDPTLAVNDCTAAFYAAIAAWQQTNVIFGPSVKTGGIYVPEGNWYISRPLQLPTDCRLFGDGYWLSSIAVGPGTPIATPGQVQGFAGPMVQVSGPLGPASIFFPNYGAPLVGGVGQSLGFAKQTEILPPTAYWEALYLSDAYPWSRWLTNGNVTAFSLQLWFKIVSAPVFPPDIFISPILTSKGPRAWEDSFHGLSVADEAFGIYVTNQGGTMIFQAHLTTADNGLMVINSSAVTTGVAYNLEIDYDGAHFDFWLDGVSQGHTACTGRIVRTPWEGTAIGNAGPEYQNGIEVIQVTGWLDSVRLSKVARHTGVTPFTPPAAKYTADSDTMALINWDQGLAPVNQPYVMAQAVTAIGTDLVPHYMRMRSGVTPTYNVEIHDLQFFCRQTTSGIVYRGGIRSRLHHTQIVGATQFGIGLCDIDSWYSTQYNCWVQDTAGEGNVWGTGNLYNYESLYNGVSLHLLSGLVDGVQDQPSSLSYIPFVFGPGDPNFAVIVARGLGNDNEGSFTRQKTPAYVFAGALSNVLFQGNTWLSQANGQKPAIIYSGSVAAGYSTHDSDNILVDIGAPCFIQQIGLYNVDHPIVTRNCRFNEIFKTVPDVPICDIPNFVVVETPEAVNNQESISTTDTLGSNLAGTFTVMYGFTTGGPTFFRPEPDGNYIVQVTPKSYVGSAPAAGSLEVLGYTTSATGFTVTLGADPGGTCTITFSYVLIRTYGDPLLYEYVPSIPSSTANPLATASPTGRWAMGVTVVPAGGNVLLHNHSVLAETVIEAGDATPSANWWEFALSHGSRLDFEIGTSGDLYGDSFVYNGKLYGIANPGPHNVVLEYKYNSQFYVDGGLWSHNENPGGAGTQQATLHIGERYDASQSLTAATLRNLKIDTRYDQVVTVEQDAGPLGMPESAFFGDQQTLGWSGDAGSFASQIADNRYGLGKYYWLAAYSFPVAYMSDSQAGYPGIRTTYWRGWAGTDGGPTLEAICVMGGINDLVAGVSSATIMPFIEEICNGIAAEAVYTPTVNADSFPTSNYTAWCVFNPPTSNAGGTTTCTINGNVFNVPFVTDEETTCTNLANDINAVPGLAAIVTASALFWTTQAHWYVLVEANVVGTAGNGILTVATNGLNGSYWYPDDIALPSPYFGADVHFSINGVDFVNNWDTDATTTCDNAVNAVNASAPLTGVVTATNVSDQMVVVAVTSGVVGNTIPVTSNTFGRSTWDANTLHGGADGAIQKGIGTIVLCNVMPFGDAPGYTAGKETERTTLNAAISAFAAAHVGDGVVLADVDATMRDGVDPTKVQAALLSADNFNPSTAGHTALYGLINPLLP